MTQSGITATPIRVRSTLEKMPSLRRVVMQILPPTRRDHEGLRAQGVSGDSRLVPVVVGSALAQPGTPHPSPTTNSAATATPDGSAPAAHATRDDAGNETQR